MKRRPERLRRLTGLDAGFLSMELPEQPMNTMALVLLRSPGSAQAAPAPLTLDDLRRHTAGALHAVPEFCLVVKPVPLGLHHPVLVNAPTFDLDDHLAHTVLPPPGGEAELDDLYGRLAAQHVDRRRPLWRLTLVDGLDDGCQALILQVQHCLMDGAGTAAALARIFSAGSMGAGGQDVTASPAWHPQRPPSALGLLTGGLSRQLWTLGRFPGLLRRTQRGAAAARARASQSGITVPQEGEDAPVCSINRWRTAQRRFARASVDLADVGAVREAADATVNDVVLAMVAGALRSYLLARDELPDRSLTATVPVAMPRAGRDRLSGNPLSRLTTTLATDVADPWERLRLIHEVTREAKMRLQLFGPELVNDWLEVFPPFMARFAIRRMQRRRQGGEEGLAANLLVSNLRGPPEPWTFGAAVAEELYLTGSPNGGLGVTIAVWDYAGKLRFGILAAADSVGDPPELVAGLQASLRELIAITEDRRAGRAKRA
jgi:WS/DGAT/MGAT family acyltransferase